MRRTVSVKSWPARMAWLGLTAIATLIGWVLLNLPGAAFALCVTQVALLLGLAAASQYLFAVPTIATRIGAFSCLFSWILDDMRPCYMVKNGKVEKRIEGNPYGSGPGVILVDSSSVLVLELDGQPSNMHGPGTAFIQYGETIRGSVDLRPQMRMRPVKAHTLDGIPIETAVSVVFQIDNEGIATTREHPFTFRTDAVVKAIYETPIGKDGPTEWGDSLMANAAHELTTLLGHYRLDELYMPSAATPDARQEIRGELVTRLKVSGRVLGLKIVSANFAAAQPPNDVTEQRVHSWQTSWAAEALTLQAEGQAKAQEHMERARAQAQLEMINSILGGFDQLARSGMTETPRELVALRLIEALERMVTDPATRDQLPQGALDELSRFIQLPASAPPPPPPAPPPAPIVFKFNRSGKDTPQR